MIVFNLKTHIANWKRSALHASFSDPKMQQYNNTLLQHFMLCLEIITWQQRMGHREQHWNLMKVKLEMTLKATFVPYSVDMRLWINIKLSHIDILSIVLISIMP
jgi:hypothetical protein